jgi:hypothetical protein
MADAEERLDRIEQGLIGVSRALGVVKETQGNQGQTLERHGQILEHHGQMLEQHGRLLAQIVEDIQPLKALPDFVKRVADDHEFRIKELEKARGT